MSPSCLNLFVTAGALLFVSGQASAQPLFGHVESIESMVINADIVVVGKLVEFGRAGQDTVTIGVEDTLKGKHRPRLLVRLAQPENVQAQWNDEMSPLLLATREDLSDEACVTDLGSGDLAVLTAAFTLLHTPDDVIRVARATVRRMPGVQRIRTLRLVVPRETVAGTEWEKYYDTGGYISLSVPVDKQLEERAHVYIRSQSYQLRREGATALRHFKSDENIAQVKKLLGDRGWAFLHHAEQNEGVEVRIYGVRKAAYETLNYWGVQVDKPTIREQVLKP